MLESAGLALLLSTLLGFLAGLGVGGGSLLMLWLTIVLDVSPETARSINLLFFLPASVICCGFRWRQGTLPLKKLLPAILSGCLSAAVFTWIGTRLDSRILQKLFGTLLLLTGFRELLWKEKRASP